MFGITIARAISRKNDTLLGKIIYIDPGHGGKDNGASYGGILEDEINLKISGYVIEQLIDYGGYVLTSRTNDYDLSSLYDKNKKRADLIGRVRQINISKADIFVSIHLNSYLSEVINGAQVFYQNKEKSKVLAENIQKHLNVMTNNSKKVKKGDYYILNKSVQPGVIVECGFLSNTKEREKLVDDEYQKKIAKKIVQGIIDYFAYIEIAKL